MRRIAEELGVHPEALRTWVKKAEVDAGARPGATSQDAQRIRQLEKEVRELRRANGGPAQDGARMYAPRAECEAPVEAIDSFIDDNKADLGACADLPGTY
ncbi:transposase [Actinomyces procaprae]|uniref:transposase n=1 Tax=Actinomyces procaprae TaxID=2560010 RepID=UPI00109DE30E